MWLRGAVVEVDGPDDDHGQRDDDGDGTGDGAADGAQEEDQDLQEHWTINSCDIIIICREYKLKCV